MGKHLCYNLAGGKDQVYVGQTKENAPERILSLGPEVAVHLRRDPGVHSGSISCFPHQPRESSSSGPRCRRYFTFFLFFCTQLVDRIQTSAHQERTNINVKIKLTK